MNKSICLLALALLASVSLSAQKFTGRVDAYGAWHFNTGHKESAALRLNYDSTLFYVHVGVGGRHDYQPTIENTGILSENIEKRDMSLKADTNLVQTRGWNINANLDFGYHLSARDLITMGAKYSYDDMRKDEALTSGRYRAKTTSDYTLSLDTLLGNQDDQTLTHRHNLNVALGYSHRFSATSLLHLSLTTHQIFGEEDKQRQLNGSMFSISRNYTAANVLGESHYDLSLHYDDQQLAGVENLRMKTGIDLFFDNDADHYRVDYNEPERPDTTFLKFHRSYLSQYTEPFFHLDYKLKNWSFSVRERPQIYTNLQWEMLNVASPTLLSNHTHFANLAEANIGYQLKDRHRFELSYSYSVLRPDYKQFSPMVRLSNNEGEFIQGNDSLRPEQRHKVNFRYSYNRDKHILTTLDVFYLNKKDKIEKVVIVNETDKKVIKTLKTFANANLQHQVGGTLRLKLNYEAVNAEAWGSAAWEHFTYYSGAKPKDEISYQVGLRLNAHLSKVVDLMSSMVYVSPTRSAYNEKNEYIGANVRLTYKSPVGVQLFVEANDIINKPRTETTWNESMTYMKVKEVYENRNCLGIGINYAW